MFSVNEFWPGEFFICDEGNAIAVGRDYIMAVLISTRLNDHARRLKDAQELCIILGAKDADALLDTAKRVIEERDSLKREIQIRRDYAEEREAAPEDPWRPSKPKYKSGGIMQKSES